MSINFNIPSVERYETRQGQLYQEEVDREVKKVEHYPTRALETAIDFYQIFSFGRIRRVLDKAGLIREPSRVVAYREVLEKRRRTSSI